MKPGLAKESRPFASLSPGLLARKGQARPAMRSSMAFHDEDLGWNDHGHDAPAAAMPVPTPVRYQAAIEAGLGPSLFDGTIRASAAVACAPTSSPSRSSVEAEIAMEQPAPVSAGGKRAFTLRLDMERHLRLRVGCTVANRSAQQLVTEALDAFLAGLPDIDQLATQISSRGTSRRR